MRNTLSMPNADSVTAGGRANFRLPIGNRYHNLYLHYSGVTLAQLTEIRVMANNKPIQTFSAVYRDKLNQFDGLAEASGILVIPFDRVNLNTLAAEEETAIDTGPVTSGKGERISSFYLEVDIAAAAASPSLSLDAEFSESLGLGAGTILHMRKVTRNLGGSGEWDIADMDYNKRTAQALNRIAFVPSANDISRVKVERNQVKLVDVTKTLNEFKQSNGVRVPQAGHFIIDRTENGVGGDPIALVGVSDYRYKLTTDGAMDVTIYAENFGALGD